MPDTFYTTIETPIGFLELKSDNKFLLSLTFVNQLNNRGTEIPEILKDATLQLQEYFKGERKYFYLNTKPVGTQFQQNIWELVKNVPYGTTISYLEIARLSGSDKNTRAVGMANSKNPVPIIIPCHRVIGTAGKLTGYVGGLERKQWLLRHEFNTQKPSGFLF